MAVIYVGVAVDGGEGLDGFAVQFVPAVDGDTVESGQQERGLDDVFLDTGDKQG